MKRWRRVLRWDLLESELLKIDGEQMRKFTRGWLIRAGNDPLPRGHGGLETRFLHFLGLATEGGLFIALSPPPSPVTPTPSLSHEKLNLSRR